MSLGIPYPDIKRNAVDQGLKERIFTGQGGLSLFLLGNIATFGNEVDDRAMVIFQRLKSGINSPDSTGSIGMGCLKADACTGSALSNIIL